MSDLHISATNVIQYLGTNTARESFGREWRETQQMCLTLALKSCTPDAAAEQITQIIEEVKAKGSK